MPLTKYDLASQALVLVGEPPIASFDSSVAGIAATQLYDSTLEAELSKYPWKFTKSTAALTADVGAPDPPWSTQWLIPAEALDVITLRVNNTPIDYEIRGNRICCNADTSSPPILEYTIEVTPARMHPAFRQAFVYRLAGLFGGSVATKADLAQYWNELADIEFERAMARDSQSATTKKVRTDRFLRERR